MAKSLNKAQLVNVVVLLAMADLKERLAAGDVEPDIVEAKAVREFAEEFTVEDLNEITQNIPDFVDEYIAGTMEEEELEAETDKPEDTNMKSILDNLHVGFNIIPGVGVGYVYDEDDLKAFRVFVAGALAVKNAVNTYMS